MKLNLENGKFSWQRESILMKLWNYEIMKTDEIIEKLFESLLQNYYKDLEEPMTGSGFVRESIDILYYQLQKIGLKREGSYIDSPEWLKNKKATINPKNNDGNCFQYVLTVALNHQNIEKNRSNNIEN